MRIAKGIGWLAAAVFIVLAILIALPQYEDHRAIDPVPQVEFADVSERMLLEDMKYKIGETKSTVVVPAGFVHDGASIPGWAHSLLRQSGPYNKAAIVHDYLYWSQACSRLQADSIFLAGMVESKVTAWKRFVIYRAVRWGGELAWKANREQRRKELVRTVPLEYRKPSAAETWGRLRTNLLANGITEPNGPIVNVYCDQGNSGS